MNVREAKTEVGALVFPRERTVPGPFDSATLAGLWPVAVRVHTGCLIAVGAAAVSTGIRSGDLLRVVPYLVIAPLLAVTFGAWARRLRDTPLLLTYLEMALIVLAALADGPIRPVVALFTFPLALMACMFHPGRRVVVTLAVFTLTTFDLALIAGLSPPLVIAVSAGVVCAMAAIPASLALTHVTRAGERLVTVFDSLDKVFWQESAVDSVMDVSHRAVDVFGYELERWTEPDFWRSRVHPDDLDRLNSEIVGTYGQAGAHSHLFRFLHADGSYRWVENRVVSIAGPDGGHAHFRGVMMDRTEATLLAENERRIAEVIANSPLGHVVIAPEREGDVETMRVIMANKAAQRMVPVQGVALEGALLSDLRAILPRLSEINGVVIDAISSAGVVEVETEAIDGRRFSLRLQAISDGSVSVALEDVTQRHADAQRIERMATVDSLTDLPNRLSLHEKLTGLLVGRAADAPVALAVLDLNHFKEVNDALGHYIGDQLLIEVGHRVRAHVGQSFVAPLGGDEFAIVSEVASRHEARELIAGVTAALDEPFRLGDLTLQSSASVGIAYWPWDGSSPDELLRHADSAMYTVKRHGLGWSEYDPGLDSSGVRRVRLLGEVRDAIERDELELWYQPIVGVATGEVCKVEALARWRHPDLGLIMPDEFVHLAEISGSIKSMTRWVVERAMADADAFAELGYGVGVTVNLSARNLYEYDLVDWFESVIERRGMPANGIELELTETDVMEDSAAALAILTRLSGLGFRHCIDDFGTGFTSLDQLRRLPMSTLKVDRSFVAGIADTLADATIVRSVIELGHNLGMSVVAEGVEDTATLTRLAQFGCDLAQGYLFAKPMPFTDAVEFLSTSRVTGPRTSATPIGASAAEVSVESDISRRDPSVN